MEIEEFKDSTTLEDLISYLVCYKDILETSKASAPDDQRSINLLAELVNICEMLVNDCDWKKYLDYAKNYHEMINPRHDSILM